MSSRKKAISTDIGSIDLAVLACDQCELEIPLGYQNGWIQTQLYDSVGGGVNIWQQPNHFCTVEHLIAYYQE